MADRDAPRFKVWGCRGSHPTPGAETLRFGGDTTCYEFRLGAQRLWIDAGTGLRRAAADWARGGAGEPPQILLSHLHLDHLIGLGALASRLSPAAPATLWWAGEVEAARRALATLYAPPFWPVPLLEDGRLRIEPLAPGAPTRIGAIEAEPFPTHHPGGCFGFEIRAAGRRAVIAADHEHGVAAIDQDVARRAQGADLVVYDASYAEAAYQSRVGWGHSTRERAAQLAREAAPRLLLMTHHAPDADDRLLSAEEARIGAQEGRLRCARDGMTIALGQRIEFLAAEI